MKKRIIFLGLVACLTVSSIVFVRNNAMALCEGCSPVPNGDGKCTTCATGGKQCIQDTDGTRCDYEDSSPVE